MRHTAHVIGGKPIAVRTQSISDVSTVNLLVAFYDIHGRKGDELFFCSVPDTIRVKTLINNINLQTKILRFDEDCMTDHTRLSQRTIWTPSEINAFLVQITLRVLWRFSPLHQSRLECETATFCFINWLGRVQFYYGNINNIYNIGLEGQVASPRKKLKKYTLNGTYGVF
jgi:hypothetical protein